MGEAMGYEGLWFSREDLISVSQKIFHASHWAHGWTNNDSSMGSENLIKKTKIINNRHEPETERKEMREDHKAFLNFYQEDQHMWGKQDLDIPTTCQREDTEETSTSVWI